MVILIWQHLNESVEPSAVFRRRQMLRPACCRIAHIAPLACRHQGSVARALRGRRVQCEPYGRRAEGGGKPSLAGSMPVAANSASIRAISSSSPVSTACARRHNCSMRRGQYPHQRRRIGQSRHSSGIGANPSWPVTEVIAQRAWVIKLTWVPRTLPKHTKDHYNSVRGRAAASLKRVFGQRLPASFAPLRGLPSTLAEDVPLPRQSGCARQ